MTREGERSSHDVEAEIRRLCHRALIEQDPRMLRVMLANIRQKFHSHQDLLQSMSQETFEALWRLRH